jgi:excisionase family DNA binding protein
MAVISSDKKGRGVTVTDEGGELMSIREAAKTLGVHPSTLRNWDRAGRLKAVRVGSRRDRRFKKSEVLAQAGGEAPARRVAQIAKALGTTPAALSEIAAQCQAAVDALRPSALAGKELRDSVAHAMDVMDPLRAVDSQLSGWLTHLNAQLSESLPRFEELFKPILWEQKLFGDQMRDYLGSLSEALSSKLYGQFAATQAELFSSEAIAAFARSLSPAGVGEAGSLVSEQIRANIAAYQDLSRAVLWDLQAVAAAVDKRLPFAELKLAGGLLASATSLAADFRAEASQAATTAVKKPNVFRYFHDEARDVAGPELLSDGELEAQLKAVKSFRAANAGLGVVEACGRINRAAQLRRQGPLLLPSVDTVTAGARLPLSSAGNEAEFSEVVDGLYKFIFEASDDGRRLRALAEPHEYAVVEDIVVLRHYYRHDLAQGASMRDSTRRFGRVGDVFERLVGRRFPRSAADWHRACLALMERVEALVTAVADRLEGRK